MDSNRPISEQFRLVAKDYVDKDAAASMLEETKSAVLAQKMLALGDMPVSRAEMTVKASEEWHSFLKTMVDARTAANLSKVKMEWIRLKFNEWQAESANRRAEMKL